MKATKENGHFRSQVNTHDGLTLAAETVLMQFEAVLADALVASVGQVHALVVARTQLVAVTCKGKYLQWKVGKNRLKPTLKG